MLAVLMHSLAFGFSPNQHSKSNIERPARCHAHTLHFAFYVTSVASQSMCTCRTANETSTSMYNFGSSSIQRPRFGHDERTGEDPWVSDSRVVSSALSEELPWMELADEPWPSLVAFSRLALAFVLLTLEVDTTRRSRSTQFIWT